MFKPKTTSARPILTSVLRLVKTPLFKFKKTAGLAIFIAYLFQPLFLYSNPNEAVAQTAPAPPNPLGPSATPPPIQGAEGTSAVAAQGDGASASPQAKSGGKPETSDSIFLQNGELRLRNSAYFYNGESDKYWDRTRITITYFGNVFEPSYIYHFNSKVRLTTGAGVFIPFDQQSGIKKVFPVIRTEVEDGGMEYGIGTLKNDHNFPAPLLDPITNFVPKVRIRRNSRKRPHNHGTYEYGGQVRWRSAKDAFIHREGEVYINWQLKDVSAAQAERFDVGLINTSNIGPLPVYTAWHYWHNGGHEHDHTPRIVENHVWAAGLRNKNFDLLYLGSSWIPNREFRPELTENGHAFFGNYNILWGRWTISPFIFYSLEFVDDNLRFVTIEGDPFFNVPFYSGINVQYKVAIAQAGYVVIRFIQGAIIGDAKQGTDALAIRYDQMVLVNLAHSF